MSAETITHFGVYIPVNLHFSHQRETAPIPEPEPECLTLVKRGDGWGIFWTLADEEDTAPDVASSLNWLFNSSQSVGRKHILKHGYQFGEPMMVCVTRDAGDPMPDLGDIERIDWMTKAVLP